MASDSSRVRRLLWYLDCLSSMYQTPLARRKILNLSVMSLLTILEATTSRFHSVSNGWDTISCKSRNVAHAAALLEVLLEVLPPPLSKSLMRKAFRIGGEGRNRTDSPLVLIMDARRNESSKWTTQQTRVLKLPEIEQNEMHGTTTRATTSGAARFRKRSKPLILLVHPAGLEPATF